MKNQKQKEIWVQRIPIETLRQKTVENRRQYERKRFHRDLQRSGMKDCVRSRIRFKYHPENANADALDPTTFYRWQLAYVRHELSNYDDLCRQLNRTDPADRKTYAQLRRKTLEHISDIYPELADACRKQMLFDSIHFSDLRS